MIRRIRAWLDTARAGLPDLYEPFDFDDWPESDEPARPYQPRNGAA